MMKYLSVITVALLSVFLLCCMAIQAAGQTGSRSDTLQIKKDLDSAWNLMRRKDSLTVKLLDKTLKESNKIGFKNGVGSSYYTTAKYYDATGKSDIALMYYDSAILIFDQTGDKGKQSQCYLMKGIFFLLQNKFPESILLFQKSVDLSTAIGKKSLMADGLTNLGDAYERLGDYAKASEAFFKCLKIDEEDDYKLGIAMDLSSIGIVYGKMGNDKKAVESFERSLAIQKEAGEKSYLGATYIAYGIFLKNAGKIDEAIDVQMKGLAVHKELSNERGIYTSYHNLGAAYQAKGDYKKALEYFNQSLSFLTEGDESQRVAYQSNYLSMAELYYNSKQYALALNYANRSLAISTRLGVKEPKSKCARLISDIYRSQGNFEQSLNYYQMFVSIKDSIYNEEKARQIEDIQTKYETEKKAQEIISLTQDRAIQDASLKQKTVIQYSLMTGIVVIILFSFVLFKNNRARQEVKRQLLAEQLKNEHTESERLKELDHLKSRFFANIAHEFRTPLTLILGPIETLISDSKGSSDRKQLTMVKNSASRLVKLVNQLLDLSKLESGAIKFDYITDDIISFLRANVFAFQSLADQKNIVVSFASDVPELLMKYDRDKLEKIFSNLLSNAFKFTDSNGMVNVHVSVSGEGHSRQIRVMVEDSGPGIAEKDIAYVFNRFYQSGTVSRTTLGSGIGLELTKELVEICGGTIGVSNSERGGAQFFFTLPLVEGEKSPAGPFHQLQSGLLIDDLRTIPVSSPEEIKDAASIDSKEIILVVEDNDDVRNYIVSSLQAEYKIITAANGEEGIARAIEVIPDLVISDVMMPVKDGMEVCATLKEDQRTSHIPVIMLTAKADVESKIEGLNSGADDYLAKPFHTTELLARIRNLILIRKKLHEKFSSSRSEYLSVKEDLPPKEHLFITKIRGIIELHLPEEEYGVEELSRDMAMSRMQLHRKIKALTGTSTSLYIRSIRLTHARHLLQEGIYNVSEVAYRVGFNSPTYFSTCFSEEFGVAPSAVRETV